MKAITRGTGVTAYNNFCKVFFPAKEKDNGKGQYFWQFIGELPELRETVWIFANEKAAHSCELLAGPHYHTIAKIMLARGHTLGEGNDGWF